MFTVVATSPKGERELQVAQHGESEALNIAGAYWLQGWAVWILDRPYSAREDALPVSKRIDLALSRVKNTLPLTRESILERGAKMPTFRDSWFYQRDRQIEGGLAFLRAHVNVNV